MFKVCCKIALFNDDLTESFSGSILIQNENFSRIYFGTRSDNVQYWIINDVTI